MKSKGHIVLQLMAPVTPAAASSAHVHMCLLHLCFTTQQNMALAVSTSDLGICRISLPRNPSLYPSTVFFNCPCSISTRAVGQAADQVRCVTRKLTSTQSGMKMRITMGKLRCIVVDASNRALRIFDNLQTHGAGNEEHEREYKEAVIKDLQRLIRECDLPVIIVCDAPRTTLHHQLGNIWHAPTMEHSNEMANIHVTKMAMAREGAAHTVSACAPAIVAEDADQPTPISHRMVQDLIQTYKPVETHARPSSVRPAKVRVMQLFNEVVSTHQFDAPFQPIRLGTECVEADHQIAAVIDHLRSHVSEAQEHLNRLASQLGGNACYELELCITSDDKDMIQLLHADTSPQRDMPSHSGYTPCTVTTRVMPYRRTCQGMDHNAPAAVDTPTAHCPLAGKRTLAYHRCADGASYLRKCALCGKNSGDHEAVLHHPDASKKVLGLKGWGCDEIWQSLTPHDQMYWDHRGLTLGELVYYFSLWNDERLLMVALSCVGDGGHLCAMYRARAMVLSLRQDHSEGLGFMPPRLCKVMADNVQQVFDSMLEALALRERLNTTNRFALLDDDSS